MLSKSPSWIKVKGKRLCMCVYCLPLVTNTKTFLNFLCFFFCCFYKCCAWWRNQWVGFKVSKCCFIYTKITWKIISFFKLSSGTLVYQFLGTFVSEKLFSGWKYNTLKLVARTFYRHTLYNPQEKYLFYISFIFIFLSLPNQWENHNKSLQLEAQTYQRIQEKIQERVMNNLGTWIDWQYLHNAAKLLAKVLTHWMQKETQNQYKVHKKYLIFHQFLLGIYSGNCAYIWMINSWFK